MGENKIGFFTQILRIAYSADLNDEHYGRFLIPTDKPKLFSLIDAVSTSTASIGVNPYT
jgi:hypothetical protein